ncbi:hypothetical protein ACFL3S_03220 [Gemmatimonadota bacterium]
MKELYQERLDRFAGLRDRERARGKRLGRARSAAFVLAALLGLGADMASGPSAFGLAAAGALSFFVFLGFVVRHQQVRRRERWLGEIADVNEVALNRLARDWAALPETSSPWPKPGHPYAADLDILGPASLFRLCTTITTPPGASTLRDWLLNSASPHEVKARQEAVEELAPQVELRQELNASGRLSEPPDPASLRRFLDWADGDPWLLSAPWIHRAAWALPLVTVALSVAYVRGAVPYPLWMISLGVAFAVDNVRRERIHSEMDAASGGQGRFSRYAVLLDRILRMKATTPALVGLQESVRSSPVGAVEELRRLGRIVGWADTRFNGLVHAPLQALLVWDVHVLAALDRWRRRSGPHVRRWLEALGKMEALCALAALKADHPDWCLPDLDESGEPGVRAVGLGHPLLPPSQCVRNDLDVGPPGTFLFITGSNMSGKSTLLRAVGVNCVLAQAGGAVCAERMTLSPLDTHTSMRTADSLAEGVSQYMAELRRIQSVVEGARKGGGSVASPRSAGWNRSVLYLLDEPLQGTNEAERRIAVQTILGHLLRAGAIGAVATHDLHLDRTASLAAAAHPVHFEGTVDEGEEGPRVSFDFRLRPGPATSTNALALLRAVGLGEEDEDGR